MSEYIVEELDGVEVRGHYVTSYLKKEDIVRCRDCRHFTEGDREYATCDWCGWWDSDTEADGFCKRGEKRKA